MEQKIAITGIAADVEVFVKNRVTAEIVSAEGLIDGSKDDPYIFDKTNKYFATTLDNVLAEFCIPPASNKEEFYNYLRKSLSYVNKRIGKRYCAAIFPAFVLNDQWLQTDQAKVFGCEPDYNAYTGEENPRPEAENPNLRSAGGHIHLGYQNPLYAYIAALYKGQNKIQYVGDPERCSLIKALDLHLGVPSVIQEPDNMRKKLYGKAGAFRPKEYGVEYRTISNYYLATRKLTYWVYDAVQAAVDWVNAGNTVDDGLGNAIQYVINTNHKAAAKQMIEEFKLKTA